MDITYPLFVTSDDVITNTDTIVANINLDQLDYEQSKVYETNTKKNIHEESIRKSKRKIITNTNENKSLFENVGDLINQINNSTDSSVIFDLIPNDLDVIKYDPNDFFKRHHDFVPIKTNLLKYYSLLLCLDADCTGGETIVYHDDTQTIFNQTVTNGKWVLFQNELDHEGSKVLTGYKIILKANVVAIPKLKNFNSTMQLLVDTKQKIIDEFVSAKNNVLPVYSLQEYLFYRRYFQSDPTVVPFQSLVGGTNELLKLTNMNSNETTLKEGYRDGNKVIFFNIFNGLRIKSFSFVDNFDEDFNHDRNNYYGYENDGQEKINSQIDDGNKILFTATKDNEIYEAIRLMLYYFWSHAYIFSKEDESNPNDEWFTPDLKDIKKFVEEKVDPI